jgi:predicted phage terminase large subunit-like protein
MVFMPPRHSKSETISRLFTAYYLYRYPDRFVGIASYGADLAYTLSRAARDHFQRAGGSLSANARAVRYWLTRRGGGLWAAGVGGPATGKGYHLGIVDDPLKDAKEAQSPTIRNRHKDWWNAVWSTREEPDGAQIIVQTRWNEDDLSGYLLSLEADEPEGWTIVHMPAIAEPAPAYPPSCTVLPDWRAEGEALCPERYSLAKLQKLAARIGSYFFGALFQQRPAPREGGLFPAALPIARAVPEPALRVRYWDIASARPGKGDYTVGGLLAYSLLDHRTYVEDVVRVQCKGDERTRVIVQTAHLDRQRYGSLAIFIERPPGIAVEVVDDLIRSLAGFLAYVDSVQGDKVERAGPVAAQAQAGNLVLIDGPWNAAYVAELVAFPNGANDDQVDVTSGGFNILAAVPAEERYEAEEAERVRISLV